jgi:hypothetical protein
MYIRFIWEGSFFGCFLGFIHMHVACLVWAFLIRNIDLFAFFCCDIPGCYGQYRLIMYLFVYLCVYIHSRFSLHT